MLVRELNRLRSRWWIVPAGMFLAVRLATYLEFWLIRRNRPGENSLALITQWDAGWNSVIASRGYVAMEGVGTSVDRWMTLAFFPVVPRSARLVHDITGWSVEKSGIAVSVLCGLAAAVVLWRLVQRRFGDEVASDSLLLLLVAPYAFVFSMFYTEGPTLLVVALCFTALDRRWWIAAGAFALLAGAMRPNGFLLVVPCLVAAFLALRPTPPEGERRPWLALAAPALAPLGFLAWIAFVGNRMGDPLGYFEIQSSGWGASFDFGRETWNSLWGLVFREPQTTNVVVSLLMLVVVGGIGLLLCWRRRLDWVWSSYAIAVVVLTAANERQASSGRFLLLAFPLYVAFALSIPKRWFPTVVAVSAVLMGAFFYSATGPGTLTP